MVMKLWKSDGEHALDCGNKVKYKGLVLDHC